MSWAECSVGANGAASDGKDVRKIDPSLAPVSTALSACSECGG